ncbi:MAG: hypothetical protein AAGA20_14425 [Planctomycetota bacterium]
MPPRGFHAGDGDSGCVGGRSHDGVPRLAQRQDDPGVWTVHVDRTGELGIFVLEESGGFFGDSFREVGRALLANLDEDGGMTVVVEGAPGSLVVTGVPAAARVFALDASGRVSAEGTPDESGQLELRGLRAGTHLIGTREVVRAAGESSMWQDGADGIAEVLGELTSHMNWPARWQLHDSQVDLLLDAPLASAKRRFVISYGPGCSVIVAGGERDFGLRWLGGRLDVDAYHVVPPILLMQVEAEIRSGDRFAETNWLWDAALLDGQRLDATSGTPPSKLVFSASAGMEGDRIELLPDPGLAALDLLPTARVRPLSIPLDRFPDGVVETTTLPLDFAHLDPVRDGDR